jgi:hypothetical protein
VIEGWHRPSLSVPVRDAATNSSRFGNPKMFRCDKKVAAIPT